MATTDLEISISSTDEGAGRRPSTDSRSIPASEEHNGWNRFIEGNLVGIGEEAICMRWMHNESIRLYCGKYARLNNNLRIFTSIIAGLTAISFLSAHYYYTLVIRLLVGLLSIIVIYISTTLKAEDYPTLITKHRLSSFNYFNVFQGINRELAFSRRGRKEAKGFYEMMNEKFNELKINSPDLGPEVQENFEKRFGAIGQIYRINVNHREDPESPPASTPAGDMLRNWREAILTRRPSSDDLRNRYEIERFMNS